MGTAAIGCPPSEARFDLSREDGWNGLLISRERSNSVGSPAVILSEAVFQAKRRISVVSAVARKPAKPRSQERRFFFAREMTFRAGIKREGHEFTRATNLIETSRASAPEVYAW